MYSSAVHLNYKIENFLNCNFTLNECYNLITLNLDFSHITIKLYMTSYAVVKSSYTCNTHMNVK